MHEQYDDESIWSFAKKAFALMRRYDCPPTPSLFTLWYEYAQAQNSGLSKAINKLIGRGKGISRKELLEICRKFFNNDNLARRVEGTSYDMVELLSQVRTNIGSAHEYSQHYSETLNNAATRFSEGNTEDLVDVVHTLYDETQQIIKRNNELQKQLERANNAMDRMSENLESARTEALTDSLTGLGNRKSFDFMLQKVISAQRSGKSPALAMADVDHFKQFNDKYGHRTGDQVLVLVSKIFSQFIEPPVMPLRYGGEEFAILFPDTDEESAFELTEMLRQKCSSIELLRQGSTEPLGNITISLGLTMYRAGEKDTEFLDRADEHLYCAKRAGRNRCISDNLATHPPEAEETSRRRRSMSA